MTAKQLGKAGQGTSPCAKCPANRPAWATHQLALVLLRLHLLLLPSLSLPLLLLLRLWLQVSLPLLLLPLPRCRQQRRQGQCVARATLPEKLPPLDLLVA